MTERENLIALCKRRGYLRAPVDFSLCPSLVQEFQRRTGAAGEDYAAYFALPWRTVCDGRLPAQDDTAYWHYHDAGLKPGTVLDPWGVAYEPGSEAAKHMTYMRHPLKKLQELDQLREYPYPDFPHADYSHQAAQVQAIHAQGLAAVGGMQCTIWETAWYLRSMEELMMDMMTDDPKAEYLLDKVTEYATVRARAYAAAGVDILFLGDDIGMQRTAMMSDELYVHWLKYRLKRVIDAARAIRPELVVFYHSCGFVTPFIPHLIDAGIDVLNPVQPECMDFAQIHAMYGDRLSFHGTIGTQTTMPFGTPQEVRRTVHRNLEIAGDRGGLFAAPTHLLEPEVPWENILAYVQACRDFATAGG